MSASPLLSAPPHHRRAHVVGQPLATGDADRTLLGKLIALSVFSSDALSSVAYATEAALGVLLLGSASASYLLSPISVAIALLMIVVVASYRQTVRAYPTNGGSYVVARANLGVNAALVAGAAVLIDYLLTVAVSVSAGVLAITSAAPAVAPYRVELALACLAVITVANLRGLRESGPLFAAPTYLFVGSLACLFAVAATRFALGEHPHATVPNALPVGAGTIGVFLILRAFASGCSALTGVEAIANGVTAFKQPQARNARITLAWLGGLACFLFLGVSVLASWLGARPSASASMLSQIASAVLGAGPFGRAAFLVVQVSTLAVLCLAANASFEGFPRLTALMAHDRYVPRQFENLGDRLVYSNGVLVLATLAGGLIVVYNAQVNSLIHLYVVGVFTGFTLSQVGMVRHWLRSDSSGRRRAMAVNAVGATATGLVTAIVILTKFTEGAWMVVVMIPLLVVCFHGIERHYRRLRRRLDCAAAGIVSAPAQRNTPLVVVEHANGATRHALWLAAQMAHERPARAVSVAEAAECDPDDWQNLMATDLALEPISSPEGMIGAVREQVWSMPHGGSEFVTVLIPEQFATASLWRALRGWTFRLKLRLLQESGVAICDVATLDSLASEPLPRRVAVRVLVSDARAASLRAAAYAKSLGFEDITALHFASDPGKAEAVQAAWLQSGIGLPIEVVASPYRDLADLVRSYANATIDTSPEQALLYVVPEIVVTGWRRLLHNFRELHIKRSVLFDSPRIMLVSVPYHLR